MFPSINNAICPTQYKWTTTHLAYFFLLITLLNELAKLLIKSSYYMTLSLKDVKKNTR